MKPPRMIARSLAFTTILVVAASPSFCATIGTTANDSNLFTGFPSIGQTFTVPTDNVITSFSARFGPNQTPLSFAIYAWNGTTITGGSLFSTTPQAGSIVGADTVFTYTGVNAPLTVGGSYVGLFTDPSYVNPFTLPSNDILVRTAHSGHDPYAGGQLVVRQNDGSFFPLDQDLRFSDMAFTAQFASVPEPGAPITLGFFALGLAGLAFRARKAQDA